MKFELLAPCHFGLESVLKKEITDLGYDILQVEDGRVTFCCDEEGIPRSNIFLRTCERVYLKVGSFHAETFDELFEGTKRYDYIGYFSQDNNRVVFRRRDRTDWHMDICIATVTSE